MLVCALLPSGGDGDNCSAWGKVGPKKAFAAAGELRGRRGRTPLLALPFHLASKIRDGGKL